MSDAYKIYASQEYVDEKVNEIQSVPSVSAPHQMLVTDADGKTVWEERPYYRTTKKVHASEVVGEGVLPTTFTSSYSDGMNVAYDAFPIAVLGAIEDKCEIIFDGKQYICEWKQSSGMSYLGATVNADMTMNFEECPFVIAYNMVITETAGEHTIDFYLYMTETKVNYGNVLLLKEKKVDGVHSLDMKTVEEIQAAWEKKVSIVLYASARGLSTHFNVTNVSSDFIYAGCATPTGKGIMCCVKTYQCSDGSLYEESFSYLGGVNDNANTYPLMYINNKWYRVTVDSSGNLKATEEK